MSRGSLGEFLDELISPLSATDRIKPSKDILRRLEAEIEEITNCQPSVALPASSKNLETVLLPAIRSSFVQLTLDQVDRISAELLECGATKFELKFETQQTIHMPSDNLFGDFIVVGVRYVTD